MSDNPPTPTSFFFGGCSWGCIYFAGVYEALLEHYNGVEGLQDKHWGGVSSGALFALGATLGKSASEMQDLYNDLADIAHKYGVFGKMSIYHEFVLVRWLPDDGLEYQQLNGRLFVGVTRLPASFELVSTFTSNADVRDVLHGSMHIPFYMTHTALVQGRMALDGGFTRNNARIDARTVTVGVDRVTELDICPAQRFTILQTVVPTGDVTERNRLVSTGKRNAAAFLNGAGSDNRKRWNAAVEKSEETHSISINERQTPVLLCLVGWGFRCVEHQGLLSSVATIGLVCAAATAVLKSRKSALW